MTTNHFSAPFCFILVIVEFFGLALTVQATPMDSEAVKMIPELKRVFLRIKEKGQLTDQDRIMIEQTFAGGDPVLVSLATCIVAESKGNETNLCAKAEDVMKKAEGMPQAFIQLMLAKKRTEGKSTAERMAAIEPLLKETNPYSRIQAAKELYRIDARKGEDALKALLTDNSRVAKGEAFRKLLEIGKAANILPVPMPAEQYEVLLSIVEDAIPLGALWSKQRGKPGTGAADKAAIQ